MYISLVGGIYKLWSLNVLENAFILNLGVLSAAVGFYQDNTDTVVPAITCTSVGITFIIFVAIVFGHLVLMISNSRRGERGRILKEFLKKKLYRSKAEELVEPAVEVLQSHPPVVTQSVVEVSLNEPLLGAGDQDNVRENEQDKPVRESS